MRIIQLAVLVLASATISFTAAAAPPDFGPIRRKATATPTPKLQPICQGVRCVLGNPDNGTACSNDNDCFNLGCVSGECRRVEKNNPNLTSGKIPPCSQEGAKCGKSYCVMGASGKGLSCRPESAPSPGMKECGTDSDCFGSKCVTSSDKLSSSCEVDKLSSAKSCVVGTPEGCMEKRCVRKGSQLIKICDWVRKGEFSDGDVDHARCDTVGESCGGSNSTGSSGSSGSSRSQAQP